MSYLRRYGAGVKNAAQWGAHVFAFGPEPDIHASWRCRCGVRNAVSRKHCWGCGR